MLLGTTCPRAALVEHLAGGEARGALRFWSHFGKTDGVIMYVPDYEPLDVPDAWRPEYELMAPLYAPDGELAGTISLDRPRDGHIPPPWANEFLELFAEQAAIAILNARRHEQALRAMRTLEQERVALHAAFAEQRARETDLRDQTRRDPLTSLANRLLLQGGSRSCWPSRSLYLMPQCGRAAGHDAPPGSRGSAALAGRDKANPVVVPGTPSARSAGCVGGGGSRGLPSGAVDDLLCHPV